MPAQIHSSAIVDPEAQIAEDVIIGPHCIIAKNVTIGARVEIGAFTIIDNYTTIGEECRIFPHAVIGTIPQDLKFKGEKSAITIGGKTIIREFVTINRGTEGGGGITHIGEECYLMAYVHVAHDCFLANKVILSNAVNLAGHIHIDDHAVIGGLSAIHQFVHIGEHAFIGGCSAVNMDIPPYVIAVGNRAKIIKVNSIGLERKGYSHETINQIKKAYKFLLSPKMNITQAIETIEKEIPLIPPVQTIINFIRSSERGICK
jgi:UDP-N-acetylglucosamine acyltransferase